METNKAKTNKKFKIRGFEADYQEMIDIIADTIKKSQIDSAREKAEKIDFELERFDKIFDEALIESDRAAAILIFAYVEDIMLAAFKRHLNGDIKGGWDEVTGGNGVLATANDRITLLALLRWIKPSTYNDLRNLKPIRNRFAHHSNVNSCTDSKISSWIANLSYNAADLISIFQKEMGHKVKPLTKRGEFIMKSCFTVAELLSNLAIAPHAEAAMVHPSELEGKEKDNILKNVYELHGRAATFMARQLDFEGPVEADESN